MERRIILGWLGVMVVAGPVGAAGGEASRLPSRDFRIVAEFGSGEGNWKSWKTTIEADGRATQTDVSVHPPVQKALTLPREGVRELFDTVRMTRFFEIPRNYEVKSTDLPTLLLTVTAHGRTHTVRVYGREELKGEAGLARFLAVWRKVLEKVPSPNPEQRPAMYGARR